MGLLFSAILSYAGALEAIEVMKHILAGMLPESEPDFSELVEYYTGLLNKSANPTSKCDWVQSSGQGYLCLTENQDGSLRSAAVKYYDGSKPDSAAILFSTKISSFGQDSVDSNSSHVNGDYGSNKTERYTTSTTKTLLTNSSESFNVGQRNRSTTPSYENISDPSRFLGNSFERSRDDEHSQEERKSEDRRSVNDQRNVEYRSADDRKTVEDRPSVDNQQRVDERRSADRHSVDDNRSQRSDSKDKLTWHYRPLSPASQTLPEIHLHGSDNKEGDPIFSEDFLRSLDGIKYRPLQRSDPSGRRRSFKKRHSSSSTTSSKESRASREEELKIFTSLEEAEFERMSKDENVTGFGSTPNLAAHSHSRSRSRENSKEGRSDAWSVQASVVSVPDESENTAELKPRLKDPSKLGSFEEERVETIDKQNEVTEEEDIDDFWGSSGD